MNDDVFSHFKTSSSKTKRTNILDKNGLTELNYLLSVRYNEKIGLTVISAKKHIFEAMQKFHSLNSYTVKV